MADSSIHVLLYPFPPSGHVIPILDLAGRLLRRPGLTVTVVVTPASLPLLQPLLSAHPPPSLQPLVLPVHPRSPPSTSPIDSLLNAIRGFRDLHSPALVEWFGSQPSPPDVIVSDFFLGWTHKLAQQLGIPRVVFSPCCASYMSIAYSIWRDLPELKDSPEVTFPNLPNCPSYPLWQLSEVYVEAGDPTLEFSRDVILADLESWGAAFNSFAELEVDYIDHMKREHRHDRVWAIGPLMPPEDDRWGPADRGGSSSTPVNDVLTWLDSHPDGSVVYVCFGSRRLLTRKQMDALAAGLELSGVRFVLCVKDPGEQKVAEGDYGALPDGFDDRVSGKGMVIRGWAPQVLILRHRAVGAFLTHCGWNSAMEGIAAGVVMLTWPMGADQFSNAKLLLDRGVGIRVGEGTVKIPEAAELARVLVESVGGGRPERARAKELSKAALSAVKPGGSSDRGLDDFIRSVQEAKISK